MIVLVEIDPWFRSAARNHYVRSVAFAQCLMMSPVVKQPNIVGKRPSSGSRRAVDSSVYRTFSAYSGVNSSSVRPFVYVTVGLVVCVDGMALVAGDVAIVALPVEDVAAGLATVLVRDIALVDVPLVSVGAE